MKFIEELDFVVQMFKLCLELTLHRIEAKISNTCNYNTITTHQNEYGLKCVVYRNTEI